MLGSMIDLLSGRSSETTDVSAEALAAALECASTPIFLLRPDGRIVHANTAANILLRGRRALRKVESRLVARRVNEAKILAALLTRVAETRQRGLLRLLSRGAHVSLLMTVAPVPGEALLTACVVDLHADQPVLRQWIGEAFDLSPQNAELAEGLMFGASLAEFASTSGVTLGAVRTRLKKLFAQTGKKSQAALVSALLRAATISPPTQQ
jgi:DNA-binding CsgD family transcriptional regulator